MINTGNLSEVLEQKRKVFSVQPEDSWRDIDRILPTNVPTGYDIDTITRFLSLSSIQLNGANFVVQTEKPSVKGLQLYTSLKIKRSWFIITDSLLLIKCDMEASMKKESR